MKLLNLLLVLCRFWRRDTREDALNHQSSCGVSRRTAGDIWSDIFHDIFGLSTTKRQWQRPQITSRYAVSANHRLSPVLTSQYERIFRVLFQSKKQTWKHFLVSLGFEVSIVKMRYNAPLLSAYILVDVCRLHTRIT